jgi:hypothetical protein
MNVDADLALDFLSRLYAHSDTGYVTLFAEDCSTGRRKTEWAAIGELETLRPLIVRHGEAGNLWLGVAPRREILPDGKRGGVAECHSIPALWIDVDIAGPAHQIPNLPKDLAEAAMLIRRYPYRPDIVVNTGYGVQCYWTAPEPLEAADAQGVMARWRLLWQQLAREARVHLDDVFTLDRLMRLPGSINWKIGCQVPVTMRVSQH